MFVTGIITHFCQPTLCSQNYPPQKYFLRALLEKQEKKNSEKKPKTITAGELSTETNVTDAMSTQTDSKT